MGKFYKGGRLWSAEAFRLQASKSLSGSDQVSLALQAHPVAADLVPVVSTSAQDVATLPDTTRTLAGTIGGSGPPAPGDTLRLAIDAANYDYVVTGLEGGPADVYSGLAAVVAAANVGAGDPTFTAAGGGTEIDLTAKAPGTPANASIVTLAWTIGSATASLVDTPAVGGGAGSGTYSVEVQYLDAGFNVQTEVVTLNGTTPVMTIGEAVYVQRLRWVSGHAAAGTITASLEAAPVSAIAVGGFVSQTLGYCVPALKQLRLIAALATATVATRVTIISNHDPDTGVTMPGPVVLADFICSTQPQDVELPYHVGPFPTGTVVNVLVQGAADTLVTAALDAYLEAEGTAN